MPPVAEYPFSELIQQPTRVTAAVEERGRVILRRRNAADLVLSRASDLTELESFARLLSSLIRYIDGDQLAAAVAETLPWTRYLTADGRAQFLIGLPPVVKDSEELGTFAPLELYLAEWRDTAAVLSDPELVDRLARRVPRPSGEPVRKP